MQELIKVDKVEAIQTLNEIESLLEVVEGATQKANSCFIDLSFLLVKAKKGAYWTEKGFKSEQEYIDKVFTQSRSQYYAFIRFGSTLSNYDRAKLKKWGRSKCEDLVRLDRHFDGDVPDEWIEHIEVDNKDDFRARVRAFLDNKSHKEVAERTERGEEVKEDSFITFKFHGGGIHTVNLALETIGKILGTDKSLGYLLENICANFNSQFTDDGTGHVTGKNAYILGTIEGLVKQLDLNIPDTSELLIGIVAKGVEGNVAS